MAPASAFLSLWDEAGSVGEEVVIDCLLPTGVIIPLKVRKDGLLADIKEELWRASQTYPLYSFLKDKNTYMFTCINQRAEREELLDEGKRICDVRPFQPMLQVVEKRGDKAETILNFQISNIIGKGLKEFESLKSSEVSDFRVRMKQMCRNIAKERDAKGWLERAQYLYPPDVANEAELPTHVQDRLQEGAVRVNIQIGARGGSLELPVPLGALPHELLDLFIHKASSAGHALLPPSQYVLKVIGREEYLIGDYPINQFHTVRANLLQGEATMLTLVKRDSLFVNEPPKIPPRPNGRSAPPVIKQRRSKMNGHSLWDIRDTYRFTAKMATNISLPDSTKVYLRAGIYHGPETMCGSLCTKEVPLTGNYVEWDEQLGFDIQLQDLPRMARLCLVLFAIFDKRTIPKKGTVPRKVKQGKVDVVPLAWVNIAVFDYMDVLRTGSQKLYMWPVTNDAILSEELLNPIGSVEFNPNAEEAIELSLICYNDLGVSTPIFFPSLETVLKVAQENKDQKHEQFNYVAKDMNPQQKEMLRAMVELDPLHVLHEQEKELIWRFRYECKLHFPHCLARLLSCVEWNNHVQVALMQDLLRHWPKLPPQIALELLDFNYTDRTVRKFAVNCLSDMSDFDLCQYLLQLVQVLKYESYIESNLVEFLLRRALRSQRVGHMFFWLLRSEMHVQSVSVRYGLILEAYCHGSIGHVKLLSKQVAALDKLGRVSQYLQGEAYRNIGNPSVRESARKDMRKMLEQSSFAEVLSDIPSSIDPACRLKTLKLTVSKFMDSKKRPLWLVWCNQDEAGPDVTIMYKKGDDLRQDMLTLQILRIIDTLWRQEGLDLRMNTYGCLATGHEEGLIEPVLDSDTIANIQKKHSFSAFSASFNKEGLFKWLQSKNKEDFMMNKAIEEFTLSCAGYCVATYVLGIGDRHSDNIMLKTNGQVFHIDFGHFLGNFKSKLGVRRERVPFVLTGDFVYIIKHGPKNNDRAFREFKQLCEDAFLILRRKAHFLITLFMMMLNTGIQQLSSIKDIHFIKNALQPHLPEEVALQNFRDKFTEALKSNWKTQLNFAAHNVTRDNT